MLRAFHRTNGSMGSNRCTYTTSNGSAYFISVRFDTELVNVSQTVIEGTFVPEAIFGTADTTVAGLNWEGRAFVPAYG